jgi:hypothetical protein
MTGLLTKFSRKSTISVSQQNFPGELRFRSYWEIYTPLASESCVLLHRKGKVTIPKLKSSSNFNFNTDLIYTTRRENTIYS